MISLLSEPFFIKTLIAALIISLASAPYGCIVVWQRIGFFGDAVAHSAFLGLAIAITFDLNPQAAAIVIAVAFAWLFLMIARGQDLSNDIFLATITYSSSAMAAILFSISGSNAGYLSAFLFGDILTTTTKDLIIISIVSVISLLAMIPLWQGMIDYSLDKELGRQKSKELRQNSRLIFTLLLAVLIAAMVKVMGALLVVGILVIPAAAARNFTFSTSPERMLITSWAISIIASSLGIIASAWFDTPTGATIVIALACVFIVSRLNRLKL